LRDSSDVLLDLGLAANFPTSSFNVQIIPVRYSEFDYNDKRIDTGEREILWRSESFAELQVLTALKKGILSVINH